ncbi:hypothetical protein ES703_25086 [subsurface metagenome]
MSAPADHPAPGRQGNPAVDNMPEARLPTGVYQPGITEIQG